MGRDNGDCEDMGWVAEFWADDDREGNPGGIMVSWVITVEQWSGEKKVKCDTVDFRCV